MRVGQRARVPSTQPLSVSRRGLLATRGLPEAEATKVRTKHMHKEDGVAIIGAGPVGLIVAHELLRRNVPIRLVEKRPGPSYATRAFTLHARSMEMFEHIGVAHRLEEVSLPCPGNVYHFDGLIKAAIPHANEFVALRDKQREENEARKIRKRPKLPTLIVDNSGKSKEASK